MRSEVPPLPPKLPEYRPPEINPRLVGKGEKIALVTVLIGLVGLLGLAAWYAIRVVPVIHEHFFH